MWNEAIKVAGHNPDFQRKDLIDANNIVIYSAWRLGIQTISQAQEHELDFDVLDATTWPEDQVPVRCIGEMELNRQINRVRHRDRAGRLLHSPRRPWHWLVREPPSRGADFSYFGTQISRLSIIWLELLIN